MKREPFFLTVGAAKLEACHYLPNPLGLLSFQAYSEVHIEICRFKEEISALRSVLSEWEDDKSCYVQWMRAEELRIQREGKK